MLQAVCDCSIKLANCLYMSQIWLLHTTLAMAVHGACRYKEAVNECTAALEVSSGYHKALTRRAKAYEQMGQYKQALSDVQKANKGSDATPETQVIICSIEWLHCEQDVGTSIKQSGP